MHKYRVVVSYCGAIDLEIEANTEDKARKRAEEICSNMPNDEFIDKLEPQHEGTEIVEIDNKEV